MAPGIASLTVVMGWWAIMPVLAQVRVAPASKPEPRRRIEGDPVQIFNKLMSKLETDRLSAAQQLHWDVTQAPTLLDARLIRTNLDDDKELEVIFILTGVPTGTDAIVFDHRRNGWWQVGEFPYWWHWDADQAEKLIELREIVDGGRKDIIVRVRNGGTGVAITELSIYRLRDGVLYRVFQTVADHYAYAYGRAHTITESRSVEFLPSENGTAKRLVVHHQLTTEPDEPTKQNPVQEKKSCTVFRWDAARFTFTPDPKSQELCQ